MREWCLTRMGRFVPVAVAATLSTVTGAAQTVVFSDDFDDGVSGGDWTVLSHAGDFSADFAYDYSARGIPPAPASAGTTVGLRFSVNDTDATPATDAVNAFADTIILSGERTLKFDLWLNYNGGPGGGSGSTEFATFGLLHAGDRVCWAGNPASDGFWFAVSGEGGDSADYRAYRGATLLAATPGGYAGGGLNHTAAFYQTLFPSPPFETAGAPGKRWVEVEARVGGGVVDWRIDGMRIAIRRDESLSSGRLMLGCMDTFASIASPAEDNFVIFDNVRVEAPDCDGNGLADDFDLAGGAAHDCNGNGRPDGCETVAAGDFDDDGDVDADDLAGFSDGMAGPDLPPAGNPACAALRLAALDADADADLDAADFAALQRRSTPGPFAPRAGNAPGGLLFMAEAATLDRVARENRVAAEVLGGNVPGFLRDFAPIATAASIGGGTVHAVFFVSPDYVCIGRDDDFARVPMTPLIAQPIADELDCLLPTRRMVNEIYADAAVKLAPAPISPATVDIMLATTFLRHHERVESQRAGQPLGALIGGIKKDVVITPQLATNPGRVAIYGWHQLSGAPIQPLYLGHVDWYADYSHGIRLVQRQMLVDGALTTVDAVLADPQLHVLLSDEGAVSNPSY